ncbi:MAG: secretin N-terminal domain-containing protein, partial [Planctomycetota bacterium]
MSWARTSLFVFGLAAAFALPVQTASGQEVQKQMIVTPDGKTIEVPAGANIPPEVLERMGSRSGPSKPGAEPAKPDDKGEEKKDESKEKSGEEGKAEDKEKDKEKKDSEKSKEGPEPIKRESMEVEPADPKELEVRPDKETGLVEFNFKSQKWLDVLEWLAVISKMSLDWQELPGDHLNLTTERSYTVPETRDLINRHLLARGYTLLSQGEVLSVAKIDKLDPGLVPRVRAEELAKRDPHEYVKVSFTLDWLLAETAVEELKPMMSPNGKLTALKATNRLEAMDAVVNLREISRLLEEEQSTTGQDGLVRTFPLKHTLAEQVLEQLQALLGIESKSKGPAQPTTPDQMRAQQEAMKQAQQRAQQQAQQGKGGPPTKQKAEIYLVANKRENSIVAQAPPDKMALIAQAVEALDVASDHAHSLLRNMERMQVYRLESLKPGVLIKSLEELGDLDFDTRLEADQENNAIIAYASLADHLTIRSLIDKLDAGGRRAEVIQLETLRAESVAKIVDFMMGGGKEEEKQDTSRSERSYFPFFSPSPPRGSSSRRGSEEHADRFRVDADLKNNALLLWCNDFELAKVENLLDSLRENQQEGGGTNTYHVYRLVTLDPEPLVSTLEAMETLSFQARLEVDKENGSVIAYAPEADHQKIRDLIGELDGSGRQFHVVPLRRLEADYVAGTIAFMMAGKEEQQQSGYSRTYIDYNYYGGGPSRGGGKEKKPDEFRVDADVEFNRLLLWANEIELEEVMNLLEKLGEIPPEGGDPSTVRVLDVLPGPERAQLLERIQRIWPSLAPNTLVTPPAEEEESEEDAAAGEEEPEDKATPAESRPATTTAGSPDATGPSSGNGPITGSPAQSPVFQFARLAEEGVEPEAADASKEAVPRESTEAADAGEAETEEQRKPESTKPEAASEPEKEPAAPADSSDEPVATPPQSDQSAVATEPAEEAKKPPPVSITEAPDGRLIITSEDTQALDRLEELIGRLAPPRKDYHWFKLRYAEAYWVAWNLKDFFEEEEKDESSSSRYDMYYFGYPPSSGSSGGSSRRLSKRRPLRFISDDDTNTILVQGATPEQLATIDDLIEVYDQPPSTDSDSARKTEVFPIRYSKATVVAEAVKDVYRDLLSDRDKALNNKPQQEQRSESRYSYTYILGDEDGERKAPKWKGYLSIGIDELSNTLIVSAPEFLFRDIERLIESLDEAARPTDAVHVMHLGQGVSAAEVQEALSKVLGEKASSKPAAKPEGQGGGPP